MEKEPWELWTAVAEGDVDLVSDLLEQGRSPHIKHQGYVLEVSKAVKVFGLSKFPKHAKPRFVMFRGFEFLLLGFSTHHSKGFGFHHSKTSFPDAF